MQKYKALLFLAVIIALVTVVPVMAECTVRPKGCTQLLDGEEVYVKFWTLQDCIDIMGPEYEDSCIITPKPTEKNEGDIVEKEERSKTHHTRSSSIDPASIDLDIQFRNAIRQGKGVIYRSDGTIELLSIPSLQECKDSGGDDPSVWMPVFDLLYDRTKPLYPEYFDGSYFVDGYGFYSNIYGLQNEECVFTISLKPN